MQKKRGKRLLAVLLAMMLVVGMLPMSAMAAVIHTDPEYLDVKMSVGQMPGDYESDTSTSFLTYLKKQKVNGTSTKWYANSSDAMIDALTDVAGTQEELIAKGKTGYANNKLIANQVYTPANDIVVHPGESFYIGFKLDGSNLGTFAKGVGCAPGESMGMLLAYSKENFELIDTKVDKGANSTITNPLVSGLLGSPTDSTYIELPDADYSKYTVTAADITDTFTDPDYSTGFGGYVNITITAAAKGDTNDLSYHITPQAEWDFLVKFKVPANGATAGDYTFRFVNANSDNNASGNLNVLTTENASTADNAAVKDISYQENTKNLNANDVTVTIEKNDPELTAVAASKHIATTTTNVTERTVLMNVSKVKVKDGVDKTGWTVAAGTNSSGTDADVKSVEKVSDTQVKVVLENVTTGNDGLLKISAPANAFVKDAVDPVALDATITVVAVPTTGITYDYANNKLTNITSTDSISYAYNSTGEGWNAVAASSTESAALNMEKLIKAANNTTTDGTANATDAIKVALTAETTYSDTYDIVKVTQEDKPSTAPTVDYAKEQIATTDGVNYKINTTSITGDGTAKSITSAIPASGSTTAKITYYTAGDGTTTIDSLSSETGAIVSARPAYVPTASSTGADLEDGLTVLGGDAAVGDMYAVVNNDVPAPDTLNADGTASGNYEALVAGLKVEAAKDVQDIWVYKEADSSNKKFASAPVKLDGLGNAFTTAKASGEADQKNVLIKLSANGTWAAIATIKSNISLVSAPAGDNSNTIDTASIAVDGQTVTVPMTSNLKEGDYVFTVANAAVTKGAPVNNSSTSNVTLTVTSSGYSVSMGTAKHNNVASSTGLTFTGKGGIQANAEQEFTLTNLKDYETYDASSFTVTGGGTVTATEAQIAADKFTYHAPETPDPVTSKVPVTIDINTKINQKELNLTNLAPSATTKVYNGTTDAPANFEMTVNSGKWTDDHDNVTIVLKDGSEYKFDNATVDDATQILATKGIDVGGADAAYYKLPAALGADNVTVVDTATITKAAFSDSTLTITARQGTSMDKDALQDAIMAGKIHVTATDTDEEELSAVLADPAGVTALATAIEGFLNGADGDPDATDDNGDISKLAVGTHDLFNLAQDNGLTIFTDDFANFTQPADTQKVAVKIEITKKPTPPPSTSGSTVSYDAGKHGTIVEGSASEDVEDGGKPANLPMVEADRPYTFVGWMLDGKLIDPTTVEINEDTVFEASYVKGFISGYEDGTVKTEKNITRAEFATMLVKMTGLYNGGKTYTHNFTDVVKDSWYENFVACAAENKIVNGMTATTFAPNQTITREQAAVMVANAMIASGEFTEDELVETTDKITDLDTAHDYAKKAIATLVEKQVINGYDDKTFRPLKLITRAEASAMLAEADNFEPTEEDIETIKGLESPFEDLNNKHWSYVYMMYASGQLDDSYYA